MLLHSEIDGSWSMNAIDEPEPSLVASDSLLAPSLGFETAHGLPVGKIAPIVEPIVEPFGLPDDRGDESTREARVNGL